MSYATGTYTSINDSLNKFAAWAVNTGTGANDWTSNLLADDSDKYGGDVFTGRRFHLQKTIELREPVR